MIRISRLTGGATAPLLVVALIGLATACGVELEPPPLELTQRESLLGAGKVIQIKNSSSEPLSTIEVTLRGPSGEQRSYTQASLEGYESFELGWKKLDGWEIVAGTEIEVACEGHVRRFSGTVD